MQPVQFAGFYKVSAKWENGKPLSKQEQRKLLPNMGKYQEYTAFLLNDGTPMIAVNDSQGNGYETYYDRKGEVDWKMPPTSKLDPGGIRTLLNAADTIISQLSKPIWKPRYLKARRAMEKDFRSQAEKNPVVDVTVKRNDKGSPEFSAQLPQ
jgi:hypothetical protein